MRFLHSADWHLGRRLHGMDLLSDQAHAVEQVISMVGDARPDAVLLAGDLYDSSAPSPEARELLDETLQRTGVPVVLLAGSHDGPDRITVGRGLLESAGIHVIDALSNPAVPVVLRDEHGEVHVHGVAQARPADPRAPSVAAEVQRARSARRAGARAVLLAHGLVAGSAASESEPPVAAAETVAANDLSGFDLVALGHLHRGQEVGSPAVTYSGSLLKYSLSEHDDAKSVSVIDVDARGDVKLERWPLTPRRDLRRVEGALAEVLERAPELARDFIVATLSDPTPLIDPLSQLREELPNVLAVERAVTRDVTDGASRARGAVDLLSDFHAFLTGEHLCEADRQCAMQVLEPKAPSDEQVA